MSNKAIAGMTETLTTEQVEEIQARCRAHPTDRISGATVASLATELLALRKMVGELEAKLAAPDWYWPAEDTSEDACAFSASEVLDDTPPGKIVVVVRGGIVETMYCAFLPAADDADSDDDFWVEEPTEEAAVLKIAEERVRRAALPTPKEPS